MPRLLQTTLALGASLLAACGAAPGKTSPTAPAAGAASEQPRAAAPGKLPAPTPREQALVAELRRDVTELSQKIGERNADKKWELASASDYVASELEAAGYTLDRQGYEVGEIVAQNLEVQVGGGARGEEIVVV